MKNWDFIKENIGNKVYITADGDLGMDRRLRGLIHNKTPLVIVKLTKNGMAYLTDSAGNYYSIPPRNVREVSEVPNQNLVN